MSRKKTPKLAKEQPNEEMLLYFVTDGTPKNSQFYDARTGKLIENLGRFTVHATPDDNHLKAYLELIKPTKGKSKSKKGDPIQFEGVEGIIISTRIQTSSVISGFPAILPIVDRLNERHREQSTN